MSKILDIKKIEKETKHYLFFLHKNIAGHKMNSEVFKKIAYLNMATAASMFCLVCELTSQVSNDGYELIVNELLKDFEDMVRHTVTINKNKKKLSTHKTLQ